MTDGTQEYQLQWEKFDNHREIVTNTLLSYATQDSSLCVLGCGLCLDLQLNELVDSFNEITLVDIADDAIGEGIKKQGVQGAGIHAIEGLDVSGIDQQLRDYRREPSRKGLEQIIQTANHHQLERLGKFDVTASTCLLSQLLAHATDCVGEEDHRFIELLMTIRKRHFELLLESLNPQGTAVVITDFVSSDSLPELFTVESKDLAGLLHHAIVNKNYLHGLNPKRVETVFQDSIFGKQVQSIQVSNPWRWATGDKIYACYCIVFKRH